MTVHVCQYFQGKSRIAGDIIALMPPHRCYVEPFGGVASVLFNKRPSLIEVWNDLYGDIVNLFVCLKEDADRLKRELEKLPYSRQVFAKTLEDFKHDILDPFSLDYERAARYFYVQYIGFGGKVPMEATPGSFGYSKRRSKPQSLNNKVQQLEAFGERLRNVIIEHLDYKDCIQRYDSEETLFYVDPPYYDTDNSGIGFSTDQHENLHRVLAESQGKWILTYDDNATIRALYKGYDMRFLDVANVVAGSMRYGIRERKTTHLIIRNFTINR